MSHGTEFHGRGTAPAHPGRHRRGGAESWTPPLPQHRPVRHHAAGQVPQKQAKEHHGGGAVADPAGSAPQRYAMRYGGGGATADPEYFRRQDSGAAPADPATGGWEAQQYFMRHGSGAESQAPATGGWGSQHYDSGPVPADPAMAGSFAQRRTAFPAPADPVMSGSPHHSFRRPAADDPVMSGSLPLNHPLQRHTGGPADPPVSGCLPLPQPSLPQPSLPQPRDGRPLFPSAHGSLPLDGIDAPEDEEGSREDQAARRTRVSLASPTPRGVDVDEDDARIYSAPPIDGLGGFTIGSVPASVTPPKTWRKAAWFATGASGAVVVGLLCAGSFLVGKPPVDQAVQGSWPGYQGVPTIADPTGEHRPPTQGGAAPGPESASRPSSADGKPETSGGGAGPVDGAAPPPPAGSTEAPASATSRPATVDRTPRKPPVTPAQRETPVKPPWWYSFPPDAQTMGDNSEKFFNTVTTDPSAASSVTTGELHDQGPQALARRYAGIAYFEVKKVSIDQQRGVTVNTVEVTHTDGTKTVEQRTLTFGDGDKITADGQ
ncbi:hypothetical protein [Amycolatopsis sp. CA-128772]|uniref:hypothetical protein n=1 Tax=Amycolatopsis sp. CA-128772 TaxID=2073159 RepID=UPI001E45ED87|nr:hypothetical protein [Amycolatopsis sp. CA-128772]